MFDLLFLGTGASVPARDRALPSVAVRRGSDIVLFDCGEGTQRQFMISRFSFMKIRAIFITHLHGDHFYGMPGLLQTMGMCGRREPLLVCGPRGFSAALKTCLDVCEGELEYDLEVRDVDPGETIAVGDMAVSVFKTEHGILSQGYVLRESEQRGRIDSKKAKSLGIRGADFALLEKGETVNGVTMADLASSPTPGASVAYTGDTMKTQAVVDAVKGVDILIHESTFSKTEADLAATYFHSTATQAAEVAKEAGAKSLVLVHISNRYKEKQPILEEAREVFPDVYVPEDFQLYQMTKCGLRSV